MKYLCVSLTGTHMEKLCFPQPSARIAAWMLLNLHIFTQFIRFDTFHYHILKSVNVRKM